jgi:hypothetical protein
MAFVRGTALAVQGHRHEELIGQLEYYCDKTHSAKFHLLNAARTADLKITLTAGGNKCKFNKRTKAVEISWDACSSPLMRGSAPAINCLAECSLFELQNGINNQKYEDIKTQLKTNQITLLQYGSRFAHTEAESTITTATIIRQLETAPFGARYVPSLWGKKQVKAYFENQGNFEDYFANLPHERNEMGVPHLKSKYRYAYEATGLKEATFKNITKTDIKPPATPKQIHWWQVWGDVICEIQPKNGLTDHQILFYYVLALDSLDKKRWTVNWNEESYRDWIAYTDDLILNSVVRKKYDILKSLVKACEEL